MLPVNIAALAGKLLHEWDIIWHSHCLQKLQEPVTEDSPSQPVRVSIKVMGDVAISAARGTTSKALQTAEKSRQKLQRELAVVQHELQVSQVSQAEHAKMLGAAEADHKKSMLDLANEHSAAIDELKSQHAAEAKKWESALGRLDSDSKLFKYTARGASGPPLAGSVPRAIFNAEPASALAAMYNGDWDYAKNENGQAVVNSNPENWPIILDWLSFGAVPSKPSESLIAECRYWQLDNLLAAMHADASSVASITQAANNSHHLSIAPVTVDGNAGFTVSGMIHHLPKRLSKAVDSTSSFSIPFKAAGRDWSFEIGQMGFFLHMHTDPAITKAQWRIKLGTETCAIARFCDRSSRLEDGEGFGWPLTKADKESMMHPRMLSMDGALHVEFTATFK